MKLKILIAILLLQGWQSAHAEGWSAGAGVGPNFSQLDAVSDDLKSSIGGTLWVSKEWLDETRFDIAFDYFSFVGATDYHALSAAYGWTFKKDSDLKPFILLGAGLGRANNFPFSIEKNQNTQHLFARFGVEKLFSIKSLDVGFIFDAFLVKLDGRNANRAYLGLPMLTLQYDFDSSEEAPQSVHQAPPAVVQETLVAAPVVIGDADQDGVKDNLDECPNTPKNTKVNSIGCQLNTEIKKNLRVEFKTDRSEILPKYRSEINEFADYLKARPDLKVTIEGHTDSVGSRKHNIKLSQARADAIRTYMITKKGIAKTRIKAIGYGPDKPEYKNTTDQNKQKNRRVIAVIK